MDNTTFTNKEEVCERLDVIVLEFFKTLKDLYHQQSVLEHTMKAGFLHLSRSRYSMGVKTVNIDSVDESKMQALVKVKVADSENLDCDTDLFSVIHCTDDVKEDIVDKTVFSEKDVNQSGLRKRNVKSEDSADNEKDIQEIKEETYVVDQSNTNIIDRDNHRTKLFDPIKWFGVLVPGSLKQSQNEFKKCTELAITVGNLQTKLENLRKKYRKLLLLKKTKFSDIES